MTILSKGICYIDEIDDGFIAAEISLTNLSREGYLNDNQFSFILIPLVNKETPLSLVENYYYNFMIHSASVENALRVSLNHCNELVELLRHFGINFNTEAGDVWLRFEFNSDLTKKMLQEVKRDLKTLNRIELFYSSIYAYSKPIGLSVEAYYKWKVRIDEAHHSLIRVIENGQRLETIRAIKKVSPYFKSKNWGEAQIKSFAETIGSIYRNESFENVVFHYEQILRHEGIGLTTMSTLLHSLKKDAFPVFSWEVFRYLQMLGYFKKVNEVVENEAEVYEEYRKTILDIIDLVFDSIEGNPDYSIISYYLKKFTGYKFDYAPDEFLE